MTGRDIALTGVPRSGTTLACQLLNQCADTIALFEPMDPAGVPATSLGACVDHVQAFMAATRLQVLASGTAPSKQQHGAVPDNLFARADAHGVRAAQAAPGTIAATARDAGFTLVVKHNAMFAAALPALAPRIDTFAIVRNPLAVLGSWNSVDLPVRNGRIPAGERLDPALGARLDAEPDRLERQLIVLDWFFSRFATQLPRAHVLPYESIVASHGRLLFDCLHVDGPHGRALEERNASAAYGRDDIDRCARALHARAGAWDAWYPREAIAALHARMSGAARP